MSSLNLFISILHRKQAKFIIWIRLKKIATVKQTTCILNKIAVHPTPVFLPGESQGQGSLVGCRLWGRIESDTTEVT